MVTQVLVPLLQGLPVAVMTDAKQLRFPTNNAAPITMKASIDILFFIWAPPLQRVHTRLERLAINASLGV
jgi:hypothetical protein